MSARFVIALGLLACVLIGQPAFAGDRECTNPDVDKPHAECPPGVDCWGGPDCPIDPGYDATCTQAASANVIFAECQDCCDATAEEIYQDLVDATGNVGQWPEEERQSMLDWAATHCPACALEITLAHFGYEGQEAVNPENVSFDWADQELDRGEHIKLWIVTATKLAEVPAPTARSRGSHEITYKGRDGDQAHIHDSDCDVGGTDCDYRTIGQDAVGEYLEDYFGPGNHGYLYGVTSVSGYCPSPTEDRGWSVIKAIYR